MPDTASVNYVLAFAVHADGWTNEHPRHEFTLAALLEIMERAEPEGTSSQ
jgi:hypothetical protein